VKLRGGHATTDPRLDRVPQFDERSRDYPIRDLIGIPSLRPRMWRLLERLDQGREGACVGFGWAHELNATPVRVKATDEDARAIYRRAQQLDEWPGEAYEGTSVLAGAKAVAERGHLVAYRWAFGLDDVLATLAAHGPVVIGVNWHRGMFNTDAGGYIKPTGDVLGGHCVCLRGLRRRRGGWDVIGRNSWGRGWGVAGDFKMRAEDLEQLLAARGDACVPVTRT
jgi:hypothetical protein